MAMSPNSILMKEHAAAIEACAQRIQNRCQKIKKDAGSDCHELRIISPTGKGLRRQDSHGSGVYGASRLGNDKWGERKYHRGNDFLCEPGQDIVCPIFGARILRVANPYADDQNYSGLFIRNAHMAIYLFYIQPDMSLIGEHVHLFDVIGTAQDISKKYSPGMQPHVHLQITDIDASLFMEDV